MLPRTPTTETVSEEALGWLAIRLIPQINRNRLHTLARHFGSPAYVFSSLPEQVAGLLGKDMDLAQKVVHANTGMQQEVSLELERMNRLGVRLLCEEDNDYPVNLHHSVSPPPILYVRGTLDSDRDRCSLAVIGSRKATTYGISTARILTEQLASQGIPIVSGFAQGIDSVAHRAALSVNGRTIGVLGTGLGRCYPAAHKPLGEEIIAREGALISEYPMETRADSYNFPERNQIIATLSLGTIITEAAQKSGTMITAAAALAENRLVFAVPGDITRDNSRGTNSLISAGAKLVQQASDITEELADPIRRYLHKSTALSTPMQTTPKDKETENLIEASLSESERIVLNLIRHELCHIDLIRERAQDAGIAGRLIPGVLLELELRNLITQMPGKMYSQKL